VRVVPFGIVRAGVVVVGVLAVAGASARADALGCRRAIAKEAARFAATRVQAVARCEGLIVRGRLPVLTACAGEPRTATVIARATAKLRRGLDRACGGADRTCGTGGDDESPAALGWPALCPDFEAAGCAHAIADCADIADCLLCVQRATTDQAISAAYGELVPTDPRGERRLNTCQRTIGAATAKLVAAHATALQRCWDARYRGRHAGPCPEPGDGKTTDRLAHAAAKLERTICRACGGKRHCGFPGEPSADAIGTAGVCPDVEGCGNVIVTLQDVVDCAGCMAARDSECGSAAAVPALTAYPESCALVPPLPVCGDGTVQGREACDDGNTDDGDGCSSACALEDATALCTGIPTVGGVALATALVASGLERPVHVTGPPLDPTRVFVVEQRGRIRVVEHGHLLPTPFLAIEDKVGFGDERGLLSVAFHPDYAANGRFFVDYTNRAGDTVVARYRVSESDPNLADAGSEIILLTVAQPFANHNGGLNLFGPDGYLYVGLGDGGDRNDPLENGQSDATVLGKLLRIDVDVETPPYWAAPADNPDPGAPPPLDLIWAKGLRNPWRFSFDRATAELYIADVGQNQYEEVDIQPPGTGGENYGWDVFEGLHCHEPAPLCSMCPNPMCPGDPTFNVPVLEYDHGEGCSITGGFVYRGCRLPDLRGTYFYADFCSAFVRTFSGVAGGAAQNLADRTADLDPPGAPAIDHPSSFGEDARGELYLTDLDGELYAIVPGE
jgi:cysteine-rich repeat protein